MAHVVGVPKREPCQKCSLPVFLAERLTVGKKVYHRTCLKCARCKSQLTPGSFYETETDGEYCCETCPDEEKSLEASGSGINKSNSSINNSNNGTNRFSSTIADRLAFFEKRDDSSKRLLQKSLSDEEKSQSLKKFEENQKNVYQTNTAFNSFLNNHYSDVTDSGGGGGSGGEKCKEFDNESIDISRRYSVTSTSTNSSEEEEEEEDITDDKENENLPPELPKSQPPTMMPNDISDKQTTINLDTSHESSQIENKCNNLHNDKTIDNKEENIEWSPTIVSSKMKSADEEDKFIKISDVNVEQIEKEQTQIRIHNNDAKNNVNVTKDSSEDLVINDNNDDEMMRINNPSHLLADIDSIKNTNTSISEEAENKLEDDNDEKLNRLSMVRARLHQFEIISNNKKSSESTICSINSSIMNKKNVISSSIINNKENQQKPMSIHNNYNIDHVNDDDDDDNNQLQNNENEEVPKMLENSNDNDLKRSTSILSIQQENLTINKENASCHINNEESEEKSNKEIPSIKMNNNQNNSKEEIEQQIKLSEENEQQNQHSNASRDDDGNVDKSMKLIHSHDVDSSSSPSFVDKTDSLRKISLSPELKNNSNTMKRSSSIGQTLDEYPEELNPFKSDDDDNEDLDGSNSNEKRISESVKKENRKSLNPFESDDENSNNITEDNQKMKPPRPPLPSAKRISTNPFGSESEDEDDMSQNNSVSSGTSSKRTPVPTPRSHISKSQNPTPEPTPRTTRQNYGTPFSSATLSPLNSSMKMSNEQFGREENFRGSTQSLASSSGGTGTRRKTKKAPAPPPPTITKAIKELFPTPESDSKKSSPSSSNGASPKLRKKRPAPAPPLKVELPLLSSSQQDEVLTPPSEQSQDSEMASRSIAISVNVSQMEKLSDEEKVFLENSGATSITSQSSANQTSLDDTSSTATFESINETTPRRRLIALDASIVEDSNSSQDLKMKEEENVVYRRKIIPPVMETPTRDENVTIFVSVSPAESEESHDRQLEKLKDNKEAKNRNRQSHISLNAEDGDPLLNKSVQGKWKRRKGPAPALPVPPRKVLQMLPLQEIRHELEVIEVQQQGLEKQGVMLEKMIRDRCEGQNAEDNSNSGVNSKEVEDLILQLFELVNEKNELFRRQAELMYLRRQHRLEQEQADLEYEIRVLMAQPERNKTDSDKAREESLIARLVEVVQLRNEVIECLEMDRLREAEEDMSIKQRLEMHTAKRDEELSKQTPTKLSKKEKKKQKELKKLGKSKKLDADKDADESEINIEKQKTKKKKKKFLF